MNKLPPPIRELIISSDKIKTPKSNSFPKPIIRESSMELLRIIAMSMIVILHFFSHVIGSENIPDNLYYFFAPFFIFGVNLFFLISGYFQVKFSLKSIFRLILLVLFFGIVNQLLLFYFNGSVSINTLIRLFLFPISSSPYWFLAVYFILIIISPILNLFIQYITISQYNKFLLVFSIVTIYNCGLGFNYASNFGYSLLQAIYLYFLAYYIRKNKQFFKKLNKYVFLGIFFISTFINSVGNYYHPYPVFFSYNGVFILIASFALFIFFTRIKFHSKLVNNIATAALGCYLLQDGNFGFQYFYNYMKQLYINAPNLEYIFGVFSLIFIGFWVLSWILTKIEKIWSVPLINFIDKNLPHKIKNLFEINSV